LVDPSSQSELSIFSAFSNARLCRDLGQRHSYKGVLRIYDATHARTISNIAFALRSIAKREDVKPIANTIWTMIEGAWLIQATRKDNIAGAALAQLADYLRRAVPGFDSSVVQNLDHFPEGPTPSNNRT
jgi:hypothetical protein